MDKNDAIALIDAHKNTMINPVEMLDWVWLRVIILNIPDDVWTRAVEKTGEQLSR